DARAAGTVAALPEPPRADGLDKEPAPPLEDPKAAIKTVAGSAPPPLPDTPDSEVKQAKAEMSVPSPAPTSAPPSKPDDLKTPPSPSAGTEPKPIMIPAAGGAPLPPITEPLPPQK